MLDNYSSQKTAEQTADYLRKRACLSVINWNEIKPYRMHEMLTSCLNHPFHFTFHNTHLLQFILHITSGASLETEQLLCDQQCQLCQDT